MNISTDETPKTSAMCGYHNLEEYHFFKSVSKRELFLILRERSLNTTNPPYKDNWTDQATIELTLLNKHGIK